MNVKEQEINKDCPIFQSLSYEERSRVEPLRVEAEIWTISDILLNCENDLTPRLKDRLLTMRDKALKYLRGLSE